MAMIRDTYLRSKKFEEEQRKKREEEARRRQFAIPTPQKPLSPEPADTKLLQTPSTLDPKTTSHREISRFAADYGSVPKGDSPLVDYFKMAREMGGRDKVDERILEATSIWRRYYKPYGGADMVWAIARSPYTFEELERMGNAGRLVLFNYTGDSSKNYIPARTTTGSRSLDLAQAVVGVGTPAKTSSSATPYELNPRGYRGVSPMNVAMTPEQEKVYKASEDYQADLAFAQKHEEWGDEFYKKNDGIVKRVEDLTGVKRGAVTTWQEWEGLVLEAKNDMSFSEAQEFERAFDDFAQARTKFLQENHQSELNVWGTRAVGKLGLAAAQAGMMYVTAGGIGAWSSLGLFGKFFTGVGTLALGSQVASGVSDPTIQAAKVSDEKLEEYLQNVENSEGQKQVRVIMAQANYAAAAGDRDSIKGMQEELQKPVVVDGVEVRPALGKGLIADGILTGDWMGVIRQASDIMVAANVELQHMLIASGHASKDLKITGAFEKYDERTEDFVEDIEWVEALERAEKDWAGQQKMMVEHPKLYAFLNAWGVPMTGQGLDALGRKLINEGLFHAPLKAIAMSGYFLGGLQQGVPALLEVSLKLDKDPEMSRLKEELLPVVRDNLPVDGTGVPFDLDSSISAEEAQWLVEAGYVTNEDAKRLALSLAHRESEIISEPTSGWVGAAAYLTGDMEERREWLMENRDFVHSINMGMMIVGQTLLLKGARMSSHGVTRTAEAFSSSRVRHDLSRIAKAANEGNFGRVSELLGSGAHTGLFIRKLGEYRYGKDIYGPDANLVQTKAAEVTAALLKEAPAPDRAKAVRDSLGLKDDPNSVEWAAKLVEMADKDMAARQKRAAESAEKKAIKTEKAREESGERQSARYDEATEARIAKWESQQQAALDKLAVQRAEAAKEIQTALERKHAKDDSTRKYRAPVPGHVLVYRSEYIRLATKARVAKRFEGREQKVRDSYSEKQRAYREERSAGKADWMSTRAEKWEESRLRRQRDREVTWATLESKVAARIAYRQQGRGDVFPIRNVTDFVHKLATDMWTGADGKYYDIFPHYGLNRSIAQKSYSRMAIEQALSRMKNERCRAFLSGIVLGYYHSPLESISYKVADFPHRVADWVGAVTNDMALVAHWRTKAAMVDFTQPRAKERFVAELVALESTYLADKTLSGRAHSILDDPAGPPRVEGATDQLTGLRLAKGDKGNAEFVGRYETIVDGKKVQREVVMSTSQLNHEIALGRRVLWAEKNAAGASNAFEVAYVRAVNMGRKIEAFLNRSSNPLRIVSVGSGGVILFGKHVLNDTARSLTMEGVKTLNLPGSRKGFHERIADIDLEASDYCLFERKVAIHSEQHYQLDGGLHVQRVALKAFDERGRAKHMQGAVDTVRRIIMGEGFRAYAQGGPEGLLRWLDSEPGRKFLEDSGAIAETKAFLAEEGRVVLAGDELMGQVIQRYLQQNLDLFHDYAALPRLSRAMIDMASGLAPRHEAAIKKAITEAYRHGENPTVDVPIETGSKFMNFFATATKAAMTPNRLNREAVFNKVFNEVFDHLTKKQKVGPSDAATIAATIARGRTAKVHFDLSVAMRFEMKHRWFAWFGTKHRLWNTWLAKAAAFYPGYAGAVTEFLDWMEERNEADGVEEWDKYNIRFNVGGREVSVNMAPWTWLMDYAIESPFGHLVGQVSAWTANLALGTDFKPSPNPFGFSLTRLDSLFTTIYRMLKAPLRDGTQEDWQTYIADLPEDQREDFTDQVMTIYALSGGEKTIEDACKEVVLANVKFEASRFYKPASTRILSGDDVAFAKMQREYDSLGENYLARREYLQLHPDFAATLGVGKRDPWEQEELTEMKFEYYRIRQDFANEITRAWRQGRLEDTAYSAGLYDRMKQKIDDLRDSSNVFKEWLDQTGEGKRPFEQAAHLIFPSISPKEWESSKRPSEEDKTIHVDEVLIPAFESACKAYGVNPGSNSLFVQMLRRKYITEPTREFMKEIPGDISTAVKNNAQLLAEYNDMGGLIRSDLYIEMTINNAKRDFWLAGLKAGKGDTNNPLFAKYSTAQKQWAGWRSSDDVEALWFQYALRNAQIEDYAGRMGWNMQSKEAVELKDALDAEVEEQWLSSNKTFAMEWRLSRARTYERMRLLKYGEGKTYADRGWDQLLQYVEDYWAELDAVVVKKKVGVSPQSESAAEINRRYLRMIVDLMNRNKDLYWQWSVLGLSLGKMGFDSHWRLEDNSDWELWKQTDPVDTEDYGG